MAIAIMVFLFLPFFVLALGITFLIALATRRLSPRVRIPLLVAASCLLLTPTFGPATIAVVPVTFGWLLIPTIVTWSWSDLAQWIMLYPRWHAFAFPATAVVSYLVARFVRPNSSFKPKPLRGSA